MTICLERGADLHTAQLMTLPLTVSCFSKIQFGFAFLVPVHHPGSLGKSAVKQVFVCVAAWCIAVQRAYGGSSTLLSAHALRRLANCQCLPHSTLHTRRTLMNSTEYLVTAVVIWLLNERLIVAGCL